MATYVNDLRLTEIATGDETGDWGDITNTNLELVAEAFSFGTEAITTNADTRTTTIADGATDPGRSIFLKYTGTLDSACTITIGPNTVSKLWLIENGTSGSQNIIISSGSGANITIPPGDTKAVYSDGAGSGAAMVDAFASLSVVDLKVQDDLTVTDDLIVNGDIDLEGSIDVNGTANLDVVDIDGAVDMATTLQVDGVATFTGRDIHSGGITIANAGQIGSVGDADAIAIASDGVVTLTQKLIGTELDISGNIDVDGTTNLDVVDIDGAVDMASTLAVAGEITANGGIALGDNDKATFGASDDLEILHDGSNSKIIDSGTGDLLIAADNNITFTNAAVNENKAIFTTNGPVVLYNDNVARFATDAEGANVSGLLDVSSRIVLAGGTDATNTTNGALAVAGGISVAKKLFVGETITSTGVLTANAGVEVKNGATSAGFVEFFEDSDNGTNKVTLIGPASTADVTLTLPASAGTIATTASAADDATALAIALG